MRKIMSQLRRDQAKDNHLSKQRVFLLRVAYTDYKTAKSHVYGLSRQCGKFIAIRIFNIVQRSTDIQET